MAHRTLRSNARINPYDAGPVHGQFIDFHSTATPDYYAPPLPRSFADEWHITDYNLNNWTYFDNSLDTSPVSSPESAPSPESPPSTPLADEDVSAPPPKSRRGRPANHIPRPRNAFMIFRSEFLAKQKISKSVEVDHRHISRIVGILWNELPEDGKTVFRVKAELEKLEHQRLHPDYRFTPTVRAQKPLKRKVQRNGAKDLTRCREVAGLLMAGKQGHELEKAVMDLDKEAQSGAPPVADHFVPVDAQPIAHHFIHADVLAHHFITSGAHHSPDVRGWTPENGISETVDVPDPAPAPPAVHLSHGSLFDYGPHSPANHPRVLPPQYAPNYSLPVEDLHSMPPQFVPNYSSSLPLDYPSPPSLWEPTPSFSYGQFDDRRLRIRLGPAIEPYHLTPDRPMVSSFPLIPAGYPDP
ncbi:hypothetical protein B0H17DRAFT_1148832 [Mycena rosella]|uniref:HMG box domain-containing protein n=1 Tax=Mycena rosella TaxID=1033263 RepID=A0AAD7C9G1_MYCRO|nr:hypothetical protein B0H17DRAFT_1148832 [Mycena rosella]